MAFSAQKFNFITTVIYRNKVYRLSESEFNRVKFGYYINC